MSSVSSSALSKDFTKGNITKQLILFSLPFMASNALQVIYSAIDMIIVGQCVNTAALSAVSQSSLIVNLATMICLGFSNGGQVLVAQALGANKKKEMNKIIGTLFLFVLFVALVMTVFMLSFHTIILDLMNIPSEARGMAIEYLLICAGGLVFTAGYNMVSAVLRGMGDSKRPFLFILIASVVNLVLDILFTGFLGWGVVGAALATVIGQAVSFAFSIFYLYINRFAFGFEFSKEMFSPDKNYIKMIFDLGLPMAIQSGFINISMLCVNSMINSIGLDESATFGVGCRIDDIINKISQGIQYAAMPMISMNIGAKNIKRTKKIVFTACVVSIIFTVFCILVYLLAGEALFKIFSDDVKVHNLSSQFIYAIIWMFPAFAVMRGSGAFIQGIGNTKLCMVLAMLDGVVLRIGLSWLLGIVCGFGFFGFVLGYGLAPYGYAIPSMLYFLFGGWEKKKTLADKI